MRKIFVSIIALIVALTFIIGSGADNVEARKKKPKDYLIKRMTAISDPAVKKELQNGWSLGGVYTDCGVPAPMTISNREILSSLLTYYEEAAKKSDDEVMKVLKGLFPTSAKKKFKLIEAGKKKLTDSGSIYEEIQKNYEATHQALNEVKKKIASGGDDSIGAKDLVESLKEFNTAKGDWRDINKAKVAIKALKHSVKKYPNDVRTKAKSSGDNLAEIEDIRKTVEAALKKIDDLGGTGCKEVHVFYKQMRK